MQCVLVVSTPLLLRGAACTLFLPCPVHQVKHVTSAYRWSIPVAAVAVVWLFFEAAMFMLPTVYPITLQTLNYAPVAVGGVLTLIIASWVLSARHWFSGPRVDVDNSDAVMIRYWVSDPPRTAD